MCTGSTGSSGCSDPQLSAGGGSLSGLQSALVGVLITAPLDGVAVATGVTEAVGRLWC